MGSNKFGKAKKRFRSRLQKKRIRKKRRLEEQKEKNKIKAIFQMF